MTHEAITPERMAALLGDDPDAAGQAYKEIALAMLKDMKGDDNETS